MGDRKLDFEVGDIVVLDKNTSCEQEVRVLDITPKGLYSKVETIKDNQTWWVVMSHRLSVITPSSVNERIK